MCWHSRKIVSITPKEMGFIFEGDFFPFNQGSKSRPFMFQGQENDNFSTGGQSRFSWKKAASDQKGKMILVWGSKRGCKHWLFLLLPSLPRWVAKFGGETTKCFCRRRRHIHRAADKHVLRIPPSLNNLWTCHHYLVICSLREGAGKGDNHRPFHRGTNLWALFLTSVW